MPNIKRMMMAASAGGASGAGAWMWGQGSGYNLGNNNTSDVSSPSQFGGDASPLTGVTFVMKGGSSGGVLREDELWMWGNNNFGQCGDGTTTSASLPVQIPGSWISVANLGTTSIGIKTGGTLWSWGRGENYGANGRNTNTACSSPIQIGSLTTWTECFGGSGTGFATKSDGTCWAWGNGGSGRLGLGSTAHVSSPVQLGSLTDWNNLRDTHQNNAQVIVIKSNGTMWAWGNNGNGQLGIGVTGNKSSPVQIGSSTYWTACAMQGVAGHAVGDSGKLWAWGYGGQGRLGLGSTTNYSSPVQIGSLTDWDQVTGHGSEGAAATRTNGTIWVWGAAGNGQHGNGTTNATSSPVQVGSPAESDWDSTLLSYVGNSYLAVKEE